MRTTWYPDNPVRAVMAENLRRVWPVSLVYFLIIFCTNVIPAYVNRDGYYTEYALMGSSPFLVIMNVVFPIAMASALFRYFHSSSGATLIHSLPLNRKTLFKGSFLSGLILLFTPVILAFVSVFPLYNFAPYPGNYRTNEDFFFSLDWDGPYISEGLLALGLTLLVLFFMFALASLSASLTGNGVSLMAITLVLNFIVLFVYLIVTGYLDTFLIGFSNMSMMQEEIILRLNPLVYSTASFYYNEQNFVNILIMFAVYFVISWLAVLAAYRLYARKRLEFAGRPISFRFAEIIITNLITLVCMAGMGMAFYLMSDYNRLADIASLIAGAFIGAVISFMVVTMLMQKTPKIFNKRTLKDFGIFAIVGILFISFTVFDLTGFTNRVPNPGAVKSAEVTFSAYPFQIPYQYMYVYQLRDGMSFNIASAEELETLTLVHKGLILQEKAYLNDDPDPKGDFYSWSGNISLKYELYGPFNLYRSYDLHSRYSNAEVREALASMPGFREAMTLENLIGYENIAGFSGQDFSGSRSSLDSILELDLSGSDVLALAKCLDNDFRRLSPGELAERSPDTLVMFSIDVRYPKANTQGYNSYSISYAASPSYTETLAWLESKNISIY